MTTGPKPPDLSRFLERARQTDGDGHRGRLRSAIGTRLQADLPGGRIGEIVRIERPNGQPLLAEIVGFEDSAVNLLPLGEAAGLSADAPVEVLGTQLRVVTGEPALGRVLDGLGQPLDGGPALDGELRAVLAPAPDPLSRPPIERPISLGVRSLDALLTLAEGQRMGLFAGAGVGKSQLLAQCARQTDADVFVLALVGERGREVGEFLDGALGPEGRRRGVVVCATSDAPPLVRMKSALTAITHAEAFRDQGKRVLLLMDSLTRFARAAREVGLSAGETPVRRGYPPSVFAALPPLLERCGRTAAGSITALCTVLVEGDDLDEPIADELRGLLDGHIVLSRALASRGHYPAVDVLSSLSRCMPMATGPVHRQQAQALRAHLARHAEHRDLVQLGAYKPGSHPALDDTLARMPRIEAFLRQRQDEASPWDATLAELGGLLA